MKPSASYRRISTGFTLVEVMVALVIFAVVAVALVRNTTSALRQSGMIEDRTIAWWLAEDEMTSIRLLPRTDENFPAAGLSREDVEMGGVTWEVESRIENTDNEFVRRVVISVYKEVRDEPEVELVGFIGRY